jgi:circadian clock protein KaiC
VVPLSSLALADKALTDRVSTGIPALDEMMEGKGFFRGSSVLVSGTAGTGKSSLAANFASAACARGEECLYFAFEVRRVNPPYPRRP